MEETNELVMDIDGDGASGESIQSKPIEFIMFYYFFLN